MRGKVADHIISAVARVVGGKVYADRLRDVLIVGWLEVDREPVSEPVGINPKWRSHPTTP